MTKVQGVMNIIENEPVVVQAPSVEKGLFRSFVHVGGAHAFGLAVSILRNKLYAIWLGAVGIGLLNQLNNYMNLVLSIGTLSSSKGLTKYVSQFRTEGRVQRLRVLMSSTLVLFTSLGLFLTLIGLCLPESLAVLTLGGRSFRSSTSVLYGYRGEISGTFLIVCATLPVIFLVWKGFLDTIIVGYGDTRGLSLNSIIGSVLSLAMLIPLVYFWGMHGAAVGFLAVAILSLFTTVYFARRAMRPERLFALGDRLIDSRLLRPVLYFGLAGAMSGLTTMATNLLVRREIINHLGVAANGIFQAGWGLSHQIVQLLMISLSAHFYPHLCAVSEPRQVGIELSKGMRFAFVLSSPLVALVIAFREELIRMLYSAAFMDAKNALVIMMLGAFIWIGWWGFSNAMMALGSLRVMTVLSVLSNLVYYLGIHVSLGRFGYVKVAFASVAACLFTAVAGYAWAARRVGFRLRWLMSARVISSVGLVCVASSLAYMQYFERMLVPMAVALWAVLVLALRRRT